MVIFMTIVTVFFVHRTSSLIGMGGNSGECRSLTSFQNQISTSCNGSNTAYKSSEQLKTPVMLCFRGRACLPLTLKANHEGIRPITVLKQSASRARG